MNERPEVRRYVTPLRTLYSIIGKTKVQIVCPFCSTEFKGFLWSLCGSGKLCPNPECKALCSGAGAVLRPKKAGAQ